jgi:hypothetical protein
MHMHISLADAQSVIVSANARLTAQDCPAKLDDFLFCFGCGAPRRSFLQGPMTRLVV